MITKAFVKNSETACLPSLLTCCETIVLHRAAQILSNAASAQWRIILRYVHPNNPGFSRGLKDLM